jgi:hypothetical protein
MPKYPYFELIKDIADVIWPGARPFDPQADEAWGNSEQDEVDAQ